MRQTAFGFWVEINFNPTKEPDYVPYVGDGVHGVPKPDVGLCPQIPYGGIPWNNIDNFGEQVDDSLVILMLEMAICLLKPLLNMLDKASVMI